MADETTEAKTQAVQAVIDRAVSYQEGAEEGTVERELRSALTETDVDLTDDQIAEAVRRIEANEGPVDAAEILA